MLTPVLFTFHSIYIHLYSIFAFLAREKGLQAAFAPFPICQK